MVGRKVRSCEGSGLLPFQGVELIRSKLAVMPLMLLAMAVGCKSASRASRGDTRMEQPREGPALKQELLLKHGDSQRERVNRGVDQVLALWRPTDGDAGEFIRDHFISDPALLDGTFQRLEATLEQLDGHFLEIGRELRRPTDLDLGPLLPVDPLLSGLDASAHLTEDLFQSEIAFEILLNFPLVSLEERLAHGPGYSRRQRGEVRLAGRFSGRISPEVQQEAARGGAGADLDIAQYNILVPHLRAGGDRLIPRRLH